MGLFLMLVSRAHSLKELIVRVALVLLGLAPLVSILRGKLAIWETVLFRFRCLQFGFSLRFLDGFSKRLLFIIILIHRVMQWHWLWYFSLLYFWRKEFIQKLACFDDVAFARGLKDRMDDIEIDRGVNSLQSVQQLIGSLHRHALSLNVLILLKFLLALHLLVLLFRKLLVTKVNVQSKDKLTSFSFIIIINSNGH